MDNNIQRSLDDCREKDLVYLPSGEFEGPFYIRKACSIIGKNTVLWTKKGPALFVETDHVSLCDLKIEVAFEEQVEIEPVCFSTKSHDTTFHNIEIIGSVSGVTDEDQRWVFPRLLPLGEIPYGCENSFCFELYVPKEASIESHIKNIEVQPKELKKGKNRVNILVHRMKKDAFLYGELHITSRFVRKIFVCGKASKQSESGVVDQLLSYHESQQSLIRVSEKSHVEQVSIPRKIDINRPVRQKSSNAIALIRGQKMPIEDIFKGKIIVELISDFIPNAMEIDPYVVLLDEKERALGDESLVFFGNDHSNCGSIYYVKGETSPYVEIEKEKVAHHIKKIVIAYAIYGEDLNETFAKVENAAVILSSNGEEQMRFPLVGLTLEKTVVGVEIYRHKDKWKINAVGSGYKDGLKRLCESYGLQIV